MESEWIIGMCSGQSLSIKAEDCKLDVSGHYEYLARTGTDIVARFPFKQVDYIVRADSFAK